MNLALFQGTLSWNAVLNKRILLWCFLFLTLAHDWIY